MLEPYGKQLELLSRRQAFADVEEKKEEMRSLAWGICHYASLLRYYARTAFRDGVLPLVTCVTLSLGKQK